MKTMKVRIAYTLCLSIFLLNLGCATPELVHKPITLEKTVRRPPVVEKGEAKEEAPAYEVLKPPEFKRAKPEKGLPPAKPIDPGRLALAKGPVMINVEKMPLPDFVIHALGETLKVSFVMDQKVMDSREPITMRMTEAIPSEKALEIVLGLFEKYNLCMEEKAGALYILQKAPEAKQPFDIKVGQEIAESPAPILQVVPLRHIRPIEIEALVKELYKSGVQIRTYSRENVLLLYGQALQIKQIMEFIDAFDVPYFQNKRGAVLKLTYWQMDDFIKQLSQILEGMGFSIAKSSKEPGILFIPIKLLRSLVVFAPDDISLKYVFDWKERLDKPEIAGDGERVFTYIPKYSRASDLVKSVKTLYGIMPAQPSAPTTPTPPTTPAKTPAASQPSPTVIPGIKISSDDQKNIILIVSSPVEYKTILNLLEEIDTPPRQVLIEATIVEFTLTDQLKYGVEWFIRDTMLSGDNKGVQTISQLFDLSSGGPGFVYQFLADSAKVRVLITAFASDNKVNILSSPRLMVLDNQEATIQVGTDISIATSEVTSP
jgi:general secretion pathway protein D